MRGRMVLRTIRLGDWDPALPRAFFLALAFLAGALVFRLWTAFVPVGIFGGGRGADPAAVRGLWFFYDVYRILFCGMLWQTGRTVGAGGADRAAGVYVALPLSMELFTLSFGRGKRSSPVLYGNRYFLLFVLCAAVLAVGVFCERMLTPLLFRAALGAIH